MANASTSKESGNYEYKFKMSFGIPAAPRNRIFSKNKNTPGYMQKPNRTLLVKKGNKNYFLRFSDKEMRIAKRRAHEQSEEFKDRYRWRSGVEAAMSEYDRRTGVKKLRVRGLKAVKYCATLKALGVNIFRVSAVRMRSLMPEECLLAA